MASLNKVFLIGNVGHTPEVRHFPDGTPVVSLSLASSETWKDKDSGEKQERTEWHRLVFVRGLAQVVGEYVKKGDPLHVEGRLRSRKWADQDGIERYVTEVHVQSMQMLGGARHTDDTAKPNKASAGRDALMEVPLPSINPGFDDAEYDIPF